MGACSSGKKQAASPSDDASQGQEAGPPRTPSADASKSQHSCPARTNSAVSTQTLNQASSYRSNASLQSSAKIMIAKQRDGECQVVLKESHDNEKLVVKVPNGEKLAILEEKADHAKVRWNLTKEVRGFANTTDLEDSVTAIRTAFGTPAEVARGSSSGDIVKQAWSTAGWMEAVIAKQADGHPEVVLKDDAGTVVQMVPNGDILTILGSESMRVKSTFEGWARIGNLGEAVEPDNVNRDFWRAKFTKAKDGHVEPILADEHGKMFLKLNMRCFLEMVAVKVLYKTVEGWAQLINLETPYCWSARAIEVWSDKCTDALLLKTKPKRGDPLPLATVIWLKTLGVWDTIHERYLERGKAELGTYMVDYDQLTITPEADVTFAGGAPALSIGEVVEVLEINTVNETSKKAVCAKIASGWIMKQDNSLDDSRELIFKLASPRPKKFPQDGKSVKSPVVALHISVRMSSDDAKGKCESETDDKYIDGIVSMLGARLERISDPTKDRLIEGVNRFADRIQEGCRAVLVFVTAHGGGDNDIVTKDQYKVNLIKDLYAPLNRPRAQHPQGVTKLFFVQCCRPHTKCSLATESLKDQSGFVITHAFCPQQLPRRGVMFEAILAALQEQGLYRKLGDILSDAEVKVKQLLPGGQDIQPLGDSPSINFGQVLAQSLTDTLPPNPEDWTAEHRDLVVEIFGHLIPRKKGKVQDVFGLLPHVLVTASEKLKLPLFKFKTTAGKELDRRIVASTFVLAELTRRKIAKIKQTIDVDFRIAQRIMESTLWYALSLLPGGDKRDAKRAKEAAKILQTPTDASSLIAVLNHGAEHMRKKEQVTPNDRVCDGGTRKMEGKEQIDEDEDSNEGDWLSDCQVM